LELVSHVEAVAGSAYVVGTKKTIGKIVSANPNLFSNEMKNEYARTGRVANWNGMTLVELPPVHKANSFDFAYDDNQILVLPANDDKFIKLVFEGDDMVRETTDNTANVDMTFDYSFISHWGVKTVFSSLFGTYTLA